MHRQASGRLFLALFLALAGTTVRSGPAPTDVPGEAERLALEQAAGTLGRDPSALTIVHREWIELPRTGVAFELYKVLDREGLGGTSVGIDRDGVVVDPDTLLRAERAETVARHGKLHPALAARLGRTGAGVRIPVTIWLRERSDRPGLARPSPDGARALGLDGVRRLRQDNLERTRETLRTLRRPLLDALIAAGYRAEAIDGVPVVWAELPAEAIDDVARRGDVSSVDLAGGALPHGEKPADEPAVRLASARSASKADLLEARGIDGTGTLVAVNEETAVGSLNPFLPPVTWYQTPGLGGSIVHQHPTACSGFIASQDSVNRGTAPGVSQIFSGNFGVMVQNGGTATTADQGATIAWAVSNGADVVSNSYGSFDDGQMHDTDRMVDYSVRNLFVTVVNSAGNNGTSNDVVSSAALGYNVLTVGSIDDLDTLDWSDDVVSTYSSWLAPATRWKPDVSAVGCSNSALGVGETSTIPVSPWLAGVGCGTSYSAPLVSGMALDLIQRDAALDAWPEAVKAIAIASALHNVEGDPARSEYDGAGAIDMTAADWIAANDDWRGLTLSGTDFTAGRRQVATLTLQQGERFRAALAYDSNPSADYASDPLEGDLDLRLYDAVGSVVAVSAGLDSWESFEVTVPADGTYTLEIFNWADSLSASEWTYAGVAWWPGHYRLDPNLPQTRPGPTSAEDPYRFDTSNGGHWWVIGLRPPPGADYDLRLLDGSPYGNPASMPLLAYSLYGAGAVDLVAIDGNHAPVKDYYPVVRTYSGSGTYSIQATGGSVIDAGIATRLAVPGWLAEAWDVGVVAGQDKWVRVEPLYGDADLALVAFDSTTASSASYYQGRSGAFASADAAGPGGSESLILQVAASDRVGLVVYAVPGQTQQTLWQLFVDDSPPTGWVEAAGGAIGTPTPSIGLMLAADDPQTGIREMRLSNDGLSWTAWEAYSTQRTWNLDPIPGLQTVHVQYRNNAGQSSAVATDDIVLEDCSSTDTQPTLALGLDAFGETELLWATRSQLVDIVYGDLGTLRGTHGDFILATQGCLEDDRFDPGAVFPFTPAPGEGSWILIRPADCGGGSYDSPGGHQPMPRDPGIQGSGVACP